MRGLGHFAAGRARQRQRVAVEVRLRFEREVRSRSVPFFWGEWSLVLWRIL